MPIQGAHVYAPNPERVYMSQQWEIDLGQRELRAHGVPVPIGNRAFEIISVLVQSAGKLVSKDDLMGRVWGAIVEENTIQVHISAIRKALGPDRGMLKTASGRGYRLLGSWTMRQEQHASAEPIYFEQARKSVRPFLTNLPSRTSDLIGRDGAVQHLGNLLSAYRAVTLTGPGGIGKTSLALEVARNLFPTFQGDAWLIELVSLSDHSLVPSAVAGILGLKLGSKEISPQSVAAAIGGKKLLLVLDNCEHVVDGVASLAETIVRLCPATSVLATSREVLRIEGEHVYRVPALDVPQSQEEPHSILEHSAVQLFIARTTALRADFLADEESLPAISAICRHLDGIPLAIELAAARAATLGPQQVASRLDDRLALLGGGRRTALPRHQTLRATLDWSYELLPDWERRLLRHLAVFPAGFTLEAATAVASDANSAGSTVVEGIANLVAKSLVTLDGSTPSNRWRLLETIRVYALEKLAKSDEGEQAARRHAEFFRGFVAASAPDSRSRPSLEEIARYGREIDNVCAALDWSFSPVGDPSIGIMLTVAYVPVWTHWSMMEECHRRIERALRAVASQAKPDVRHEMQLLSAQASTMLLTRGVGPETNAALTSALAAAESLDDADYRLRALWGLHVDHLTRGYYQVALAFAERFRGHATTSAGPADLLIGERMIGAALHVLGNQIDARRHIERMLDHYVVPIDWSDKIRFQFDQRTEARCGYSRILWLQGFADQAMRIAADTVEDALAIDHPVSVLHALNFGACPVALLAGDLPAADGFVRMLLDLSVKHGVGAWSVVGRWFKGALMIRRGDIVAGLEELRPALARLPEKKTFLNYVQFLAEFAQGLGRAGKVAEGLLTIEEALARCERSEEGWYVAELLRVKGELLLQDSGDQSAVTAGQYFGRAIEVARRQGALMWELRSATSLAGLRVRQGRHDEARKILAPVYNRFTEGFEATDLHSARTMLDSLPPHSVGSER
jgi:predicted ATPase/DNA-binding winged helix-turn-helix (wHTH) protein